MTNEPERELPPALAKSPDGPLHVPRGGLEVLLEPVPQSPPARAGRLLLEVEGLRNALGHGSYDLLLIGRDGAEHFLGSAALYRPKEQASEGTDFVFDVGDEIDTQLPGWRQSPSPLRVVVRPAQDWAPEAIIKSLTLRLDASRR